MTRSRQVPYLCEPTTTSLRTFNQDSPMSTLMAAHLAKWWKSKFLNGYKQFTVVPTDCSDGRASDTEELLGRHDSGVTSDKDERDGNGKTAPPSVDERRQPLNFEEFECDVSVEGGVDAGGQERQEFSFTLYDFDGHGKITKDDIAGLVTTIYDTLGSSIRVPHYGSKTIKVKLTVSPDQRKKPEVSESKNCPESGVASPAPPPTATHRVKFKRDLNVTIRESRVPRRTPRRRRCPVPPPAEDSSSCRSGASANNDDGAADISEDDDEDRADVGSRQTTPKSRWGVQPNSMPVRDDQWWCGTRNGRTRARRYRTQHTTAYRPPEQDTPRSKNRSSSLQREELLQIIQANMEKNNLSFQTSRKPCDRGLAEHRHHRHRHKLHYLHDPRTNCYLDLAGLDARTIPVPGRCDCQMGISGGRGHHRSRSHDLTHQLPEVFHHSAAANTTMSPASPAVPLQQRARSRSHETELLRHERRYPPIVLGHTSSPHHLKHRNREQDQARAMAQVVRWLEQEFSSSLNTTDKLNAKNTANPQQSQPPPPPPPPPPPTSQESPHRDGDAGSPGVASVERHEHHHIHEHIHHHYHHYQDAPVLV